VLAELGVGWVRKKGAEVLHVVALGLDARVGHLPGALQALGQLRQLVAARLEEQVVGLHNELLTRKKAEPQVHRASPAKLQLERLFDVCGARKQLQRLLGPKVNIILLRGGTLLPGVASLIRRVQRHARHQLKVLPHPARIFSHLLS
jgi:hypothetical protein